MKKTKFIAVVLLAAMVMLSSRPRADTGPCGGVSTIVPFTDVAGNLFFCEIAEAFFSGLTNGTTSTTYSPHDYVPREQMAAFITRTQDSALRRGDRRATLKQWATPTTLPLTGRSNVGFGPFLVESDGVDLWVGDFGGGDVKRVRASDGKVLETRSGATNPTGVLVARGLVYVAGETIPGALYVIHPAVGPGPVTTLSSSLGDEPRSIATDGRYIWTANLGGSISRVDPDSGSTTNISTGFIQPYGILFDGANLWVTDFGDGTLKKLDSSGNILQTVQLTAEPVYPVFDGSNIWVPCVANSVVSVIRAKDGLILATLSGNGLFGPSQAAFDGQRILVTNLSADSLSMWKATDLTPIGSFATGTSTRPTGACSDGINFWITLNSANQLAQF